MRLLWGGVGNVLNLDFESSKLEVDFSNIVRFKNSQFNNWGQCRSGRDNSKPVATSYIVLYSDTKILVVVYS